MRLRTYSNTGAATKAWLRAAKKSGTVTVLGGGWWKVAGWHRPVQGFGVLERELLRRRLVLMNPDGTFRLMDATPVREPEPSGFPVGARVLVDGRDEARVTAHYPLGSSSFLFPHYKVDFTDGDQNVAVNVSRVGVDRK